MGWPKGLKRGSPSDDTRKAISRAQKKRWSDPEARARAIAGCYKSWTTGDRAKHRVAWTPEMDAEVKRLYLTLPFRSFRYEAPKKLGVSDGCIMQRLRSLGLVGLIKNSSLRPTLHNTSKFKNNKKTHLPVNVSPELRRRQKEADRYVEQLLNS